MLKLWECDYRSQQNYSLKWIQTDFLDVFYVEWFDHDSQQPKSQGTWIGILPFKVLC